MTINLMITRWIVTDFIFAWSSSCALFQGPRSISQPGKESGFTHKGEQGCSTWRVSKVDSSPGQWLHGNLCRLTTEVWEHWSGGLTGGISRRNKQIAVDLFVTFAGLHQLLLVYGFDIPGTRAKGWPLWLGFQAQMWHLGRGRDGPGLLSDPSACSWQGEAVLKPNDSHTWL